MNRNGQPYLAPRLAVNVVTAVHAKQYPSITLEKPGEVFAGN